MIQLFKWCAYIISLLILCGCTALHPERTGGSIDVYPVTQKYALSVESDRVSEAKESIKKYIDLHRNKILSNDIELIYQNDLGSVMADYASSYLHSIGVLPERLVIKFSHKTEPFDFELVLFDYQVQAQKCSHSAIGNYYLSDNGCFAENARWISMENPEKMLPTTPNSMSARK